ncbi:FmdB family zinc ribbon protein [Hoeflea sp.]|uniref:FmdB family zinc ribbon protein n=1 Tax=Hoeflea sp. TaxID=1940281 RepID=UPI0032EEEBD7
MPFYNYECETCGQFNALGRVSAAAAPTACPTCGVDAPRAMSAPRVAVAADAGSSRVPRSGRSSHPAGCSCCGPVRTASTSKPNATSFLRDG